MDEPGIVQMRRHRVLVIQIENERFLTDVGIRSESPGIPVKLVCDEIQSDGICEYRFQRTSQSETSNILKTYFGLDGDSCNLKEKKDETLDVKED